MHHFQRLLETHRAWIVEKVRATISAYRKSVQAREEQDLRRRYMNG